MRFFQTVISPLFGVLRSLFDPARWFELPRRLGRLSLPALTALGTFTFLVLCLIAVGFEIIRQGTVFWLYLLSLTVLLPLAIVISAVVYYAVYLWQLPEYETFDDIQTAWDKGVAELERLGLQIYDLPLFLVLGVESHERLHQLFQASGVERTLTNFPAGRSALHWYAGSEAVFVACSDVGCLTQIAQRAVQQVAQHLPERRGGADEAGALRTLDFARTCWPTQPPETVDGSPDGAAAPAETARPGADFGVPINLGMTLEVPSGDFRASVVAGPGGTPTPAVAKQRLGLERDPLNRQIARVEQLSRLMVAARQPRAPVNGIVTLLPLNMILCDASEGPDIKEAAAVDLQTLVRCLRLRCPTYVIVSDWEDDTGFQELVRRLPSKYKDNPFGKGNRPGDPPTPDRLEAVARNATAAFEDFVYHLFKQPEAITKPGNRQLYSLLCKVRRYLHGRLVKIVADGYSCDERHETAGLFGGCYFMAAGREGPSQAFARGVFQKIVQQHRELEWTTPALRRDRFYRRLGVLGFSGALGLLMLAIVLAHRVLAR